MGGGQGSAATGPQQKLAALAARDSNAETVNNISEAGTAINAAQVAAAGTAAWSEGTLACFAGRVIAPLGGAMLGAALANAVGADRPVTQVLNKMGLPTVAKPGKAPARVGHKIVHENAFAGALAGLAAGLLVGIAIAAAAAAIVATGGAAAAVLAAAGPAVVGFVAGAIGGFVGAAVATGVSNTGTVTGQIADGSHNVSFEGKPVARVTDPVICNKDPGMPVPQIAQGSNTISVNGLPLARIGHKITCSAVIQEGCATISADLTTGTYGKIDANVSVLEQLFMTKVDVVTMRSATKEGGLLDGKLRELLGEPVDMATGDYADYRTDFTWPHVLPLTLSRVYAGRQPVDGLLGDRWICNWSQRLEYRQPGDGKGPPTVTFFDADGQQLIYPIPHEQFHAFNLWAPHYVLRGNRRRVVIFDERSQQSLIFEPAGAQADTARLIRIEDRNGNAIDFVYNALGRLCQVKHSAGFTVWVNSDANGLLQSVSEHAGGKDPLVSYRFDRRHRRLTDVHSRFHGEFHFGYTNDGWLDHWRDSGPTSVDLEYDARGRVIATRTNTALYDDRFEYQDDERRATYIDALGHRHDRWFDAEDRLIRSRDPLGRITQFAYDEYGWVSSRVDPLGRASNYDHDARGRLLQFTDWHGRKCRYRWSDAGQLLEQQYSNGTLRWHYNAEGNVVALRTPAGETRWRYSAHGHATHHIDTDGSVQRWEYDASGYPTVWADPLGRKTHFSHDRFGRLISYTDTAAHSTRYTYAPGPDNPCEALSHVEHADGSVGQRHYDREGRVSEVIDPLGHSTHYTWGAFDLLASVTDAARAVTRYHHDGAARLTGITNAAGQHWALERDAAGQLIAQTDWSGRRTRYERNALGQVVTKHQPDGATLRYDYDGFDRLVSITGERQRHTFVWDGLGQLIEARVWEKDGSDQWQPDNDVQLEYDDAHRLVSESQHGRSLRYGYDAVGRTVSMETQSGRSRWQYDPAGQLETLESNGHRFDFAYGLGGQETSRRYRPDAERVARQPELAMLRPDGFVQHQGYDPMRRLESQTVCAQPWTQGELPESLGQQVSRQYGWDAAGQCVGLREMRSGVPQSASEWRYDSRGQIVEVQHHAGRDGGGILGRTERYEYDSLGHIAGQQHDDDAPLSHHFHRDQLIAVGLNRYQYDERGRMIVRCVQRNGFRARLWRFAWDEFDRLREVLTPDGERWRYRYDAFGRRISKQCEGACRHRPRRIDYLWQGSRLVEEWCSYEREAGDTRARNEIRRWHYRPGSHAVLAQERLCYKRDPSLPGSEWYPLACDPNGAPHTMYNSEGRAVWRARSSLWGETERDTTSVRMREMLRHVVHDPYLAACLTAGDETLECELRFAGQWADEESGLHYNCQRYYDPQTGQYLSGDPIGLEGGLNVYRYAPNPVGWIDPLGLSGLLVGAPLPDGTQVFRVGSDGPYNFDFNDRELASIGKPNFDPPGISVVRAGSAEEATQIWNEAFPNRPATSIGQISAEDLRGAGFDVIHNPTKGRIGANHARLVHPGGVERFNANKGRLSNVFKSCGG